MPPFRRGCEKGGIAKGREHRLEFDLRVTKAGPIAERFRPPALPAGLRHNLCGLAMQESGLRADRPRVAANQPALLHQSNNIVQPNTRVGQWRNDKVESRGIKAVIPALEEDQRGFTVAVNQKHCFPRFTLIDLRDRDGIRLAKLKQRGMEMPCRTALFDEKPGFFENRNTITVIRANMDQERDHDALYRRKGCLESSVFPEYLDS
jgi:hypothetical protein